MASSRPLERAAPPRRTQLTVQWCEALDRTLDRMDRVARDELLVLDGRRPLGRIGRREIEAIRDDGNWLGGILVGDAMRRRDQRSRRLMM